MKALIFLFLIFFINLMAIGQDWNQVSKLVSSDRDLGDYFGGSVSISGNYAIVGAQHEDNDVNNQFDMGEAGGAYIFKKIEGNWEFVQKIVASDRAVGDNFGYSVCISGDYAIVGAAWENEDSLGNNNLNDAGSAYIFKNIDGHWTQIKKLTAQDRMDADNFGYSVAIDQDFAIVGARYQDYDSNGQNVIESAGAVYVFKNNSDNWNQIQKIVSNDRGYKDYFGSAVSLSGEHFIVGSAWENENSAGTSTLSDAGSAYIFKKVGTTWVQEQKLVPLDRETADNFGYSVAISGTVAVIGARYEDHDENGQNGISAAGSAYIFEYLNGNWVQTKKAVASDRAYEAQFGWSVAAYGDFALVGAFQEDSDQNHLNSLSNAGAAYLFKKEYGNWMEIQKLTASDRNSGDNFGISVAVLEDYSLIGAFYQDYDETGQNGLSNAGAAYFFQNSQVLPVEFSKFTGHRVSNRVALNWETSSESGNYGFEVQRLVTSLDKNTNDWKAIGFVQGHGTSTVSHFYSYEDISPVSTDKMELNYRLKQIDLNGGYQYSNSICVNEVISGFHLLSVYPNPFNPISTIRFSLTETGYISLKIFNLMGQDVAELVNSVLPAGVHEVEFEGENLASGKYFIRLQAGDQVRISTVTLLK